MSDGVRVLAAWFERPAGQLRHRNGAGLRRLPSSPAGDDLVEYMEMVAARYPGRVVVVWDNLNVHFDGADKRWTQFNDRHGGRFEFVYTPKHASWTNQIEI